MFAACRAVDRLKGMRIESLDHVALWVSERDAIADAVTSRHGMHVIERTHAFTLVGSEARRGKLTLFGADGPRERGALKHIALRVTDLDAARKALDVDAELPDGLVLRLVQAETDVEFDLDHVALFSRDPVATAEAYLDLGFVSAKPNGEGVARVEAAGAYIEFHDGDPGSPEQPLLNHVAVLVPSADDFLAEANERRLDIANVVDAANTKAVFVNGPEGVKIEYVEHKATFSLV
jgi:catechol 2,3-dioxygenase-like lactoylglutathione lyase family enzyme